MEDFYNQNDFEEFLQDQVRNHRMYPSDAVWREIDKKLHGDKTWPALTIAAFAILSATIFVCVYFTPKPNIFAVQSVPASIQPQMRQKPDILTKLASSTPFSKERETPVGSLQQTQNTTGAIAQPTLESDEQLAATSQAIEPKTISSRTRIYNTPLGAPTLGKNNIIVDKNTKVTTTTNHINNVLPEVTASPSSAAGNEKALAENKIKPRTEGSPLAKDYSDKNMVDQFLNEHKADIALHTAPKKISLKHKLSFQVYVAPSISYRKLSEDHSVLKNSGGGPVDVNYVTDVNNVVRHKPGTGLEVGFGLGYHLAEKVRLKAGLQFNVRQYSIEAYKSNGELARIALVENNRIDTVNTFAVYRNSNGYYSTELENRYYQIAAPLGIEWEILGNKTVQLNVAGSIQPTYLLNRNAYLLSTNFKNYIENPEIVRKWNINSNIETFISVKVGDFTWQLGPQLRYQPYSTFIPQYPIKEHLLDYGIKFGMSKVF
jgi:hypothetical protein